jgi:hypothetical protein
MLEVVKFSKIFVVKSSPSWKIRPNTSRLVDLLNKTLGLHIKEKEKSPKKEANKVARKKSPR